MRALVHYHLGNTEASVEVPMNAISVQKQKLAVDTYYNVKRRLYYEPGVAKTAVPWEQN